MEEKSHVRRKLSAVDAYIKSTGLKEGFESLCM